MPPPCPLPAVSLARDRVLLADSVPVGGGLWDSADSSGPFSPQSSLVVALSALLSKFWACLLSLGERGCHSRGKQGTCFVKDLWSRRSVSHLEQRSVFNDGPRQAKRFQDCEMWMFLVSFSRLVPAPQERGHQEFWGPALHWQGGSAMDGRSSFLSCPCQNDSRPKMVEKYGNHLKS